MTELGWDQVDVSENISEAEQKASENISSSTPVGKFLITVISSDPKEKTFNAYSCYAANLKMRIDKVLKAEQPLLNDKGKAVMNNGEAVNSVQEIPADKAEVIDNLILGQFVMDEINLFHPKEKEAMKKRRLYVAKKLGLMGQNSTELPTSAWANAAGHKCIIETEWNFWTDKGTGQVKKNVKVKWDGYEFAPVSEGNDDADLDTSFDTGKMDQGEDEKFDI